MLMPVYCVSEICKLKFEVQIQVHRSIKNALFFIAATEPALRDNEGLRKKALLPVVRFMNGPEYEI